MKSVYYMSSGVLFFLSISSLSLGVVSLGMSVSVMIEWIIIEVNSMSISVMLLLDWMSFLFLGVVLLISGSVLFYSDSYMSDEKEDKRFVYLVLLFVFSMGMLILSPSLIFILLGWDGLGLVSYCLVIYYQNKRSYSAGMITALSNRVGDVCLLLSIAYLFSYGSWNFYSMGEVLAMISFLVVVAGMTKSAQMPFSAWLPAAMAAPTPVSALVHSSTLVTAGVYLLIRFSHIFCGNEDLKVFLFIVASLTMFMAGVGACYEMDFKKVIALSTLSQLGLMMMILSLGEVKLAFFHLLTHALFKALLFMCAGKIIHIGGGNQDIRLLGGLGVSSSMLGVCFLSSNLALCGAPFMAGFYSKDMILECVSSSGANMWMYVLMVLSTMLTCLYSFRVSWLIMFSPYKGQGGHGLEDEESGYFLPLFVLCMGAIFGGGGLNWLLMEESSFYFLEVLQGWPLGAFLVSIFFGLVGMSAGFKKTGLSMKIIHYVSLMWYLPILSSQMIIGSGLARGGKMFWESDQLWGEVLGGQGLYYEVFTKGALNQQLQTNSLSVFIMVIFMWGLLYLLLGV